MSALRPLPPRPSLEFEHKEAKALLRRLRAGDADAIARARAHRPDTGAAVDMQLSDAQLVIAREYGFASWPKLVHYFEAADRQQHAVRSLQTQPPEWHHQQVRGLIARHHRRNPLVGVALATYVPRLYGLPAEDVFAATISEDEARLTIARQDGHASWESLLRSTALEMSRRVGALDDDPIRLVSDAMKACDVDRLRSVLGAYPELRQSTADDHATGHAVAHVAIDVERWVGREAFRGVFDWLTSHGFDMQLGLNRRLCGRIPHTGADEVRYLIERGADPNWIAPNGIPVLEHALLTYWDGDAVDTLAAVATPRDALWIAAGLGEVDALSRWFDRDGKPIPAARRLRPDFAAVGLRGGPPTHPDPTDEQLLMEAFFVAAANGRGAVIDDLASRGFPIDSLVWGAPVIELAVGNGWVSTVEALMRWDSNVDVAYSQSSTPREIAREIFVNNPQLRDRRRIVELLGMDPDAILAERAAQPPAEPQADAHFVSILELAGDDAFRLGQSEIMATNLLIGLLRGPVASLFTTSSGIDLPRFREAFKPRILASDDRVQRPKLPLTAEAQAILRSAIALAAVHRREMVGGVQVLYALVENDSGPTARLLLEYGSSAERLRASLGDLL